MADKTNTPRIRFKGFTDAWEQRGFSSAFEILQNNTLSRADLNYESGLAQNVHYGDVLIKFGEVLNVENEPLAYINSEKVMTSMKNSYLQNGDVIIADTAEDTAVGKCSEIANLGDRTVLSGLHTIPVRPKEKFASGYLGYYLNSNSYHDTLIPLMQGTKVTSISKSALQGTCISYPKSLDEQAKIGQYFTNFDHLITLHQRECEKLANIKKSMLEKMFPRNGNNVPEIRFKGFTDAWEQRKLNEICNYTPSSLTATSSVENGKFDLYDANSLIGKVSSFHMSENYITVIKDGAGVGRIRKLPKNTAFIGTMGALTSKDKEQDFLFSLLEKIDLSKQFSGSTIPHIYFKDYGNEVVFVPSIKEQQQIGQYFTNLDTLITLHQRKLKKLQNIKKSCLEKMFPACRTGRI